MSEEKYVVRRNGTLLGGYSAKSKEEALDAHAKEQGHASFKELVSSPDKSASDYTAVHADDAHK